MNLKRTMSQALHASKLTEEAAAFVAAGAAGTVVSSKPAPSLSPEPRADVATLPVPAPALAPGDSAFVHSPLPAERHAPVSMTFRLPAELPAALLRVAMERKLRREEPFTQQDIVAQAVREWLERNAQRG